MSEPRVDVIMGPAYGWDKAAPGSKLWRLREHPDSLTLADAIEQAQALDAAHMALRQLARGAAALGRIRMHWGARRACFEYDGRDLCPTCALAIALDLERGA